MSAPSLPAPQCVLSQNILPAPTCQNEPVVETTTQVLSVIDIPGLGGKVRRATVANTTVPANNDSALDTRANPGSGIVHPNGATVYYLDLAPRSSTPMHRTVSVDYLVVLDGSPTLVTPMGDFSVVDGEAKYTETVDTVIPRGSTVVQRGQLHAWQNRTDEWVRMVVVVVDAEPQFVEADGMRLELGEIWL
ncbi:hypothetical protein Micbo1qcDRAFT_209043 [Microdochium bolleyi]|uniref:Cupin 2 conserved barrel domain-containing protein n=1 Tax=Microdochium bolleyi TaxID=196109 RepID=A0A136IN13_9PEZI|nr:hypothetical protein Micbo1qcDRAFT_209043 [Microdochium bolleyi]